MNVGYPGRKACRRSLPLFLIINIEVCSPPFLSHVSHPFRHLRLSVSSTSSIFFCLPVIPAFYSFLSSFR